MATDNVGAASDSKGRKRKTYWHNGVELYHEPYPFKGKTFFLVSTGGGMESIYVEEYSTVWAHYEGKDAHTHAHTYTKRIKRMIHTNSYCCT